MLHNTHLAIVEQNFALLEAERKFQDRSETAIFAPLEVQENERK